jgi:alpha-galactosidase
MRAAQALVDTGLNKLGYECKLTGQSMSNGELCSSRIFFIDVIMDDCWHAAWRDPNPPHVPRADETRFPDGIKALAGELLALHLRQTTCRIPVFVDKVHDLGLKIGIYSSAGTMTCAKQFGSLGYEEVDAKTWEEWGIDYVSTYRRYHTPAFAPHQTTTWSLTLEFLPELTHCSKEYDNCFNEGQAGYDLISYNRYAKMSHALNATGRPMVYAMCNWGEDGTWNWAPVSYVYPTLSPSVGDSSNEPQTIAHTWRISGDIMDVRSSLFRIDLRPFNAHRTVLRRV